MEELPIEPIAQPDLENHSLLDCERTILPWICRVFGYIKHSQLVCVMEVLYSLKFNWQKLSV